MAAMPAAMEPISLREGTCLAPFVDALDLSLAADAGTAMEAIRTVADRLAGTG
jgi:hypothetical protein